MAGVPGISKTTSRSSDSLELTGLSTQFLSATGKGTEADRSLEETRYKLPSLLPAEWYRTH